MAITDQLKSLYVKLGGDPNTGASNIEEWIDKIEDVAGSGSGSGGGTSTTMVVDSLISSDGNGGTVYTIDHVAGELFDFIISGGTVLIKHIPEYQADYATVAPILNVTKQGTMYIFQTLEDFRYADPSVKWRLYYASGGTDKPKATVTA